VHLALSPPEQCRAGTRAERFREVSAGFAGSANPGRILPAMRSSHGFRTAPIPAGWVQTGERWALWYNGRETASITPDGGPGVRLWMEGQKFWHVKEARAANVRYGRTPRKEKVICNELWFSWRC